MKRKKARGLARRGATTLLLLGALWTLPAIGQTPRDTAQSAAEQRRAEERDARQRDQAIQKRDALPDTSNTTPTVRLPSSESPCFPIRQIELRGDDTARFSWVLDALTAPDGLDGPLRRCLGAAGVGIVAQRAQQALLARGFVTSRVMVEPQDLNEGHLTLTLIPGRIGRVRFDDPSEAGQSEQSLVEAHQFKGRGFLSKQTNTFGREHDSTQAQASELGGQSVSIASGQDVRITGSSVIADQDLSINAVRNVSIEAAQNTGSKREFNETKKSGLFASGAGITLGKQQQSTNQQGQGKGAAASTVGAIAGDVSITAGRAYAQAGSDVLSPVGDIHIQPRTIAITEARETSGTTTEQKFKQSGVTLAISSQLEAAGNTKDTRMQGLAAANSAFAAKGALDAIQAGHPRREQPH